MHVSAIEDASVTDSAGGRKELTGAGTALFQLVRFWSRRGPLRAAEEISGEDLRVHDIVVLDAVDTAAQHTPEVSVTDVAHQLGLDHSGASRFVAATVERGYLARRPSTVDSRRAALTVTDAGQDLLTASHAWQDDIYARLTATWEPDDAARFSGYLRRLADELTDTSPM